MVSRIAAGASGGISPPFRPPEYFVVGPSVATEDDLAGPVISHSDQRRTCSRARRISRGQVAVYAPALERLPAAALAARQRCT